MNSSLIIIMKSKLPAVFAESQTADKQINADEMTHSSQMHKVRKKSLWSIKNYWLLREVEEKQHKIIIQRNEALVFLFYECTDVTLWYFQYTVTSTQDIRAAVLTFIWIQTINSTSISPLPSIYMSIKCVLALIGRPQRD